MSSLKLHPPVFLLLSVLLVYAWSFPGHFHVDDQTIVARNPLVQEFPQGKILTSDYWGGADNSGLYRPLTILSLALNRLLLGSQPWGFIAVNLALFAAITLLLYQLLRRWTGNDRLALIAAGLFALHPIHAEVVNTAVGRSELLVALFIVSGLLLAELRPQRVAVWVALCYAGAFLSKEHGVLFPAMLLTADLFQRRSLAKVYRERWPLYLGLVAVFAAVMALRLWGIDHGGVPRSAPNPTHMPLAFLDDPTRIGAALLLQARYLWQLLFPAKLLAGYGGESFVAAVTEGLPLKLSLLAAGLAGVGWLWWRGWQRQQFFALILPLYGWSFLVTANLLFATGATFADRLAFLPSAWFCAGVAIPAAALVDNLRWRRPALVALLVVALWLALLGVQRNRLYGDPVALWQAVVAVQPDNVEGWLYLADAQKRRGDRQGAGEAYRRLVELAPRFEQGLNAYADYLLDIQAPEQAIIYARRALAANPGRVFLPARLTLARALVQVGAARDALRELELTRNQFVGYGAYWETRGRALAMNGDHLGALQAYRREQAVYFPADSDVLMRQGDQLLAMQQYADAEQAFRRDVEHRDTAAGWNALGVALALQKRYAEALPPFERAMKMSPATAQFRGNFENALKQSDQPPQ